MRVFILLVTLGWIGVAGAMAQPAPAVRDGAELFDAATESQVQAIAQQLKKEHKKDLIIESFNGTPTTLKGQYTEANRLEFLRDYFRKWAGQRAGELKVEGVYVLICRQPRYLQVEVDGQTLKKAFTAEDRGHLRDQLSRSFKKDQYNDGLLQGAQYVKSAMDRHLRGAGIPVGTCATWALIAVGVIVLFGLLRVLFARHAATAAGQGPPAQDAAAGGGGFMRTMLGGLLGAAIGGYIYDRLSHGGGSSQAYAGSEPQPPADDGGASFEPDVDDGGGADFGDSGE
jgi:uncharacterized membrane protein YgcG